ncbi:MULTISPECIES: hypothetical protein [Micromonospora]|uniref:Uncharacterized protein n=1 Tax=Micromonospora yangpuensis TaxID=683228 RepID=A0A1C6U6U1_9ACTN|nr:hypothetical protein [Micromonospora yangpuensis]GGL90562.1 hypothetical protein GCM10012279_05430 [Micromonospora yangpuensis]SCL49742.1 hypothetical protein GA0070617_1270 [Micromonospora yangpuensis]
MSSTSIDDLLGSDEERPATVEPRRSGGRIRAVLKFLAVTAAASAVVVAVLRAVGLTVSLEVVVAGVVAVLTVHRVSRALAPPPTRRVGTRLNSGEEPGTWNFGARDALRTAINGWGAPLEWSAGKPERFTSVLLPRLGELADERMRQRHGLTRDSDPVRARALLGEKLWTFLETPPRRTPSPRDLAAIVADLEKI